MTIAPKQDWTPFNGGECPVEEEVLLDLKFDNGHVLEGYYAWDVKWNGANPGFGYLTGYRESAMGRKLSCPSSGE